MMGRQIGAGTVGILAVGGGRGQTFYLLLGVVSVGSPGGLGIHHVVRVNP